MRYDFSQEHANEMLERADATNDELTHKLQQANEKLAALQAKLAELEAENMTMYAAILEASQMGSLRCKVELQRIARNEAKKLHGQ